MKCGAMVVAHRCALAVISLLLFLSACTVSLVPRYDPSIVDGLNAANVRTMALFSSVANGSPAGAFPRVSDRYDEVIGSFGALRLQAMARAVPPLAQSISNQLAKVSILAEVCRQEGGDSSACVNSTPSTLQTITANLSRMRDEHRTQGLAADAVALFKNAHETSMQNVLAVETALKRE